MSASSKVLLRSVVMAWAAITTRVSRPCFLAKASEQRIAAAAPQVGGQHCRRVIGSNTVGEAMISSRLTGLRNTANGLLAAWLRAFTEMRPKISALMPYSRM
ncbi:hypothetical protein D3C77_519820 [compost metagenome]